MSLYLYITLNIYLFWNSTMYNAMDKRGGRTYLFIQPGSSQLLDFKSVYESLGPGSDSHAERQTPELLRADPNLNVWMNKSPCTKCAKFLIDKYKKVNKNQKPTLHVAYFFSYTDHQYNRDEALKCLAKMYHEGFKIKRWNWNTFKTFLGDKGMIQLIDDVQKTSDFINGQKKLQNTLDQAQKLATGTSSSTIDNWCI